MNEDRQVLPAPYLNAVWKYHSVCDALAKGAIRKSHSKNKMNSRTGGGGTPPASCGNKSLRGTATC